MKITSITTPIKPQITKTKKNIKNTATKQSTPAFKNWAHFSDIDIYKEKFAQSLKERKDEIFAHLDSLKVTKMGNGTEGNVSDILKSFFTEEREYRQINGLMHKTPRENVEPIINDGFDFSKIKMTEYGPGMYFSKSETELLIYPGDTVGIDFEGTIAVANNIKEYNSLKAGIANQVRKYLNLEFTSVEQAMAESEAICTTIVNEYCREKIVNELGIDGASVPLGNAYFEVFNPKAIKNVYKKTY